MKKNNTETSSAYMRKLFLYSLILVSFVAKAQEKDKNLSEGNEAFSEKKYADAEAYFRISQSKNPKKSIASYNLGNSIYRQNQAGESKYQFAKAIKTAKTRSEKHSAFHNLGNALMQEKDYSNAVEAYKNALRNNPADEETRYNYALAKEYLKNNPPKKDDKKDKDKKDKDKKDDKKDGNKDKKDDKGKDKEDDKKDGKNDKDKKDDKNKDQGKPQPQPGGISKERLESLLDAVNNEEKKVQDKVNLQKVKANPKKAEKDW
jgi:tetratricopeptide (TPR) repeat protein